MAFNNSISLVTKALPILDEVYKAASKTSILDTSNDRVRLVGAHAVQLFKTSMNGLGDYDRNAGYPTGSVTGTWETLTLNYDRGRAFQIDVLDNEESIGMAFGTLAGEFIRTRVAPEADARRFALYSANAGTSANADITIGTTDVPSLISTAEQVMGDAEVPEEGRILFVSEKCYAALKAKITRYVQNDVRGINTIVESYDDMRVIKVPAGRFNTAINELDGTTVGEEDGGFTVGGYPINFMIVHPSAIVQIVKHVVPRVFSPEVNQQADGWKFLYRVAGLNAVEANKVKGIYLHRGSTAN
jgi:hypothetical protein